MAGTSNRSKGQRFYPVVTRRRALLSTERTKCVWRGCSEKADRETVTTSTIRGKTAMIHALALSAIVIIGNAAFEEDHFIAAWPNPSAGCTLVSLQNSQNLICIKGVTVTDVITAIKKARANKIQ